MATCIMQVELSIHHGNDDTQEVVDMFHFDVQELLTFPAQAVAEITRRAEERLGDRMSLSRLAYLDDEGDWCTLNKDTFHDAVQFGHVVKESGKPSIIKLQVRMLTTQLKTEGDASVDVQMKVEPDEEQVPASSGSSSSSWQEATPEQIGRISILEQMVLKELNDLSANADVRLLLPKLAAAGLRLIEEFQQPALFKIVEVLSAIHDGSIKAEFLPTVLPQLVTAGLQLPAQAADFLVHRMREEAEKAKAELQQEHAAGITCPPKTVEVHQNVACDGCEVSPIIGARWKSLTMENYDLCEACFRQSAKNENEWRLIRSNVTGAVVGSFFGPGEAFEESERTLAVSGPAAAALEAAEEKTEREEPQQESDEDDEMEEASGFTEEAALNFLLTHPQAAVRKAAEAIQDAAKKLRTDLDEANEENKRLQSCKANDAPEASEASEDHQEESESLDEEWAMADAAARSPPEKGSELTEEPAEAPSAISTSASSARSVLTPSASVVRGSPLLLGVEAEEDEAARGDVTLELAPIMSEAGARQAFRMGRVALPAGSPDTPAVPICAKIVVVNDGKVAWPATTAVAIVSGEEFGFPHMELDALQPGEAAEVVIDLTVPTRAEGGAASRSSWAIVDSANGMPLGPVLIFEVTWVAKKQP